MLVAVLSDIHSNLAALDAVLDSLGTVDVVWHLGDVVGYGPEPDAVVDRLRAIDAVGVRGNHDDAVYEAGEAEYFNSFAAAAVAWTRARIWPATRDWLKALPPALVHAAEGFTLVHGSPRDPIGEYMAAPWIADECLPDVATPHCLVGHTHVPVVFRQTAGRAGSAGRAVEIRVAPDRPLRLDERRCVLNPGSVGQPRDGDPRASCLLLDTDAGLATWHRVPYDIRATQAAILSAGLPPWLAHRLSVGQ